MRPAVDPRAAFQSVDFDWVARLDSVWRDAVADVPDLHFQQRAEVTQRLDGLSAGPAVEHGSELGLVYVGNPGSGKTHFLSFVRHQAFARRLHFVLVDMTDVRDFWSILVLGYLDSLARPAGDHRTQLQLVLQKLIESGVNVAPSEKAVDLLSVQSAKILKAASDDILQELNRRGSCDPADLQSHQDVVRALLLLNSRDFETSSIGHTWLQGVGIDDVEARRFGIKNPKRSRSGILKGLSWCMSLSAPAVLAFDQLDAIVAEQDLAAGDRAQVERDEAQKAALSIIESIAGGLAAVVDQTRRTLPIVTALNRTWMVLQQRGLQAHKDRFKDPPAVLRPIENSDLVASIVGTRLSAAYKRAGFQPAYATWPFQPAFFKGLEGAFPRQVLQKCDEHKRRCAAKNEVTELGWTREEIAVETPPASPGAASKFDTMLRNATPDPSLLSQEQEDVLGELVLRGCEAFS